MILDDLNTEALKAVQQNNLTKAQLLFQKALSLDPKAFPVHSNLANVYIALGRFKEAYTHLYEAIRLNPQYAEGYNNLGRLLYKEARFSDAIPYFEKALRLDPNYWEAHYNLALSLCSLNQFSRAQAHYQEVLRLVPEHPIAHFNLGLIYTDTDEPLLAKHHLEKALEKDPNLVEALRQLGPVYVNLGEFEKAIQTYEKALLVSPLLADVHHNLAILYLRSTHKEKALQHFEKALSLDPKNDTAKHMLMALSNQGADHAPTAYIEQLFDQYAPYYNDHLKNSLNYQAPLLLRNAISPYITNDYTIGRVLDLGCGTGLCGVYFRDLALELIGVDLSSNMIDEAKKLNTYEKLIVSDFNHYLKDPELTSFKIVIASDVLVYAGNLDEIFKHVKRILEPNGFFVFSTENLSSKTQDYALQTTGRFAHTNDYIHALSEKNQFELLHKESRFLREKTLGTVWVLQRLL